MDVLLTGGITTGVECLSLAVLLHEFFIISIKARVGKKLCIFMTCYLPAKVAPASGGCFDGVVFQDELHGHLICED